MSRYVHALVDTRCMSKWPSRDNLSNNFEDLALRIHSWLVTPGCSQRCGQLQGRPDAVPGVDKRKMWWCIPRMALWSSPQKSSKCPKQQTPWCSTQPPLGCWQMCFIWGEKFLSQVKGSWPLEISSAQKVDTFDVILMDTLSRPSLLGIHNFCGFFEWLPLYCCRPVEGRGAHHEPRSFGVYGLTD